MKSGETRQDKLSRRLFHNIRNATIRHNRNLGPLERSLLWEGRLKDLIEFLCYRY